MRDRLLRLFHRRRADGQERQPSAATPPANNHTQLADAQDRGLPPNVTNHTASGNTSGQTTTNDHLAPTEDLSTHNDVAQGSAQENEQTADLNLFKEAHEQFLVSLPSSEKEKYQRCQSAEKLLMELQNLPNAGVSHNIKSCADRVKRFGDTFEPFFTALGFVSQGHPFAAMAWGSILFVFKLTNNYVSFFEKFASLLETLGRSLPQYDDLVKFWRKYRTSPTQRLKAAIVAIYSQLLVFLRETAGIFLQDQKKLRRKLSLLGGLSWQPFDARFGSFLDHLTLHRKVVEDELQLAVYLNSIKALAKNAEHEKEWIEELRLVRQSFTSLRADQLEELKNAEQRLSQIGRVVIEQAKEDEYHRAQRWIQPPTFQLEFENAIAKRDTGTCEWLFSHSIFSDWHSATFTKTPETAHGFDQSVLSIHGNPGCGKTVLAASTIEHLRKSGASVYFYFFRWDDKSCNESHQAYRALLAQMLHARWSDNRFQDAVSLAKGRGGQPTASRRELVELMDVCLSIVEPHKTFIVLDAIDECSDGKHLIRDLLKLHKHNVTKVALFSRPNTFDLPGLILKSRTCAVNRENVGDLRSYLSASLTSMKQNSLLPEDADVEILLAHLLTGADGMFLWARLMMEYLEEATSFTPRRRVRVIMKVTFPERLERMYERIKEELSHRFKDDIQFAHLIITWLTYGKRPLTTSEMRDAAIVWSKDSDYDEFEPMVLKSCVWLVETYQIFNPRSQRWTQGFRFIHQTAKEYVMQFMHDPSLFAVSEIHAHCQIARICVDYIRNTLPPGPLSGALAEDIPCAEVDDRLPLCDYATSHWIEHLSQLQAAMEHRSKLPEPSNSRYWEQQYLLLLEMIKGLLVNKKTLMVWVEAAFVFKRRPDYQTLRNWSRSLDASDLSFLSKQKDSVVEFCLSIAGELEQLDNDWKKSLTQSPCHIWLEVTAFGDYTHLLNTQNTKHTPFYHEDIVDLMEHTEHLKVMEMEAPDGTHISKLLVIPSKNFTHITKRDAVAEASELLDACNGWRARYEVWTTGRKPRRVSSLDIDLDEDEIWTLMHQCLWFGTETPMPREHISNLCKVHFPLAICPTLKSFIILRDIYDIPSLESGHSSTAHRTSRVTFDFLPACQLNFDREHLSARFKRRISCALWGCPQGDVLHDIEGYLYSFIFSSDGKYILYRDEEGTGNGDRQLNSNLVVLELIDAQAGVWSLVTATTMQSLFRTKTRSRQVFWWEQKRDYLRDEVHAVFHPSECLLSIQNACRVHIWPFKSRAAKLFLCYSSHLPSIHDPVAFSECGRYVLISENRNTRLIFCPIPKIVLRHLNEGGAIRENPQASTSMSHINKDKALMRTTYEHDQSRLVQSSLGRIDQDGTSRAITTARSQDGVTFEVFQGAETSAMVSSDTIDVVRLPDWSCMDPDSTTVSIVTPTVGERDVKVFLKKRHQLWSVPSPLDVRFPAIVHRDIGTIRVPRTTSLLLGHGRKTDGRESGVKDASEDETSTLIEDVK